MAPSVKRSGNDRRTRNLGPPDGRERRKVPDRRDVPTTKPREPTPLTHILDFVTFRAFAFCLITGTYIGQDKTTGVIMLVMPDLLHGRNNVALQIVRRWLEERA